MQVSEGTSFEMPDSTWSRPVVELGDSDFDRLMVDWKIPREKVEAIPLQLRYMILSRMAQLLIAANQRQARANDEAWVTSAGDPMMKSAMQAVREVREKIS
jgi:hypothetical protein